MEGPHESQTHSKNFELAQQKHLHGHSSREKSQLTPYTETQALHA